MQNLDYVKKICFGSLLIVLSGCSFLIKSQEVISMNDFEKLVNGKFENTSEVVNLF